MPDIILTDEQTKAIAGAFGPIPVRDASGNVVGHLEPKLTPEVIAELKRRAATGPHYTSAQVQGRLQALQAEWDRTGGFDEAHMRDLLARLDSADPPTTSARGQPQ